MEKAFEAFMNVRGTKEETIAAKEKAEEVHKLLSQYQEQLLNELVPISHEIDISVQVEIARSHVKGKEFSNALFSLAFLGTPSKMSQLRQEVLEIAVENPIYSKLQKAIQLLVLLQSKLCSRLPQSVSKRMYSTHHCCLLSPGNAVSGE
ncbi:MAG: hypothetical protein RM368_35755 [Nostoc sp. DedSLP03]|uniref:hypothetical protein n=1 Tax=Nostoc sp. DedSLP03 TaxID=3075400 RepID=UPI002AD3A1EC|nr:hypothetical protein [Nostoc sp. DedSLP03]MDZ7970233.1 hypothetical protein [Nostoc sp. DedSLP03]